MNKDDQLRGPSYYRRFAVQCRKGLLFPESMDQTNDVTSYGTVTSGDDDDGTWNTYTAQSLVEAQTTAGLSSSAALLQTGYDVYFETLVKIATTGGSALHFGFMPTTMSAAGVATPHCRVTYTVSSGLWTVQHATDVAGETSPAVTLGTQLVAVGDRYFVRVWHTHTGRKSSATVTRLGSSRLDFAADAVSASPMAAGLAWTPSVLLKTPADNIARGFKLSGYECIIAPGIGLGGFV